MPKAGRANALTYAVRFRVLARYGGQMTIVLAVTAAAPSNGVRSIASVACMRTDLSNRGGERVLSS